MRAAVWIVFEPLDFGDDPILIAPEIDHAIMLLVTATLMAHGHMALVVAAGLARLALSERGKRLALVQLGRDHLHHRAPPRRGGFDFDQRHRLSLNQFTCSRRRQSSTPGQA